MDKEKKRRPPPAPTFVLRGHTAPVYCCSFARGGKMLASGAGDGSLMLWDAEETRRCLVRFAHAHGDKAVNAARFAGIEKERLWTQGRDGFVKQWDVEQQVCVSAHEVGALGFVPMSLCTTRAGAVFAAVPDGGDMKSVLLLALDARAKDAQVAQHWKGRDKDGMCMRLCATERASGRVQVFAGYESGQMAVREADGREAFVALPTDAPAMPLTALAVDGSSGIGVVGGAEKTLFPFCAREGEEGLEFGATRHVLPKPGVNDIAIRDDLKVFASAGWDGKIRCWAAQKKPRLLCVCDFHEQPVNCVSFRPRSSVMAAGSSDGKISLWDVLGKRDK
jgi:WD40 repeat protein